MDDAEVIGIIPADEKYNEMKAIYDACRKNKVRIPAEVDDFFDGCSPNGIGMEMSVPYTEGQTDGYSYITIDIQSLPENVRFIQFRLLY